jgi:RNA polymerase sigma-70 factor (ECF subfamily)
MALVSEALGELDDETRQVILLRHVEGMSSQEVAAIMGVAEGTVWSRLHRGLDRLRARLAMRKVEDLERPARKRSQP